MMLILYTVLYHMPQYPILIIMDFVLGLRTSLHEGIYSIMGSSRCFRNPDQSGGTVAFRKEDPDTMKDASFQTGCRENTGTATLLGGPFDLVSLLSIP